METLNYILSAVIGIIGALGGGSIFYIRQTKQLKKQEVINSQADEWKRLYDEKDEECKSFRENIERLHVDYYNRMNLLNEKVGELNKEKIDLQSEISKLKLEIQKLRWFHCTQNGCKNRKPPHYFDLNGNEVEEADL